MIEAKSLKRYNIRIFLKLTKQSAFDLAWQLLTYQRFAEISTR
jgi:hypothetical protein